MAINIIERIISPYNSSPNTVIHKDRYNLFVPLADVNKVGIAGYSPEYFTVRRNIVELNNVFTASLVLNKVNDNYPYTGVRANTIYSAYNATVIDRRQPDGTETLMSVVGSLLVLSDRYDGGVNTLTEVLFAEGRIWLRKTRVGDDGTINILTKFEPVFDKCVTENQLGDFSVSTRKIIDGAIQASKIARGAVTGDKIADDAIDSSKIIDGAITVDKLADDSISSVSYDPKTGVLTFTTLKNETQKIDLPLELLIIGGRYDKETKDLILVLANDTEIIIPLDDIIAQIESLSTKIYVGGTLEDRLDFTDDPQKQLNKSVNVSKVQTFTSEEKTQALSNIGIEANPTDSPNADLYTIKLAGETYSVPHVEMTLSDESDYTAAKIRTIRFGDDKYRLDGDYVSYLEEQMLTEESKARARKNIGVDATVAGSRVYINGVLKDTVDFDSDPQSQIDNRVRFDRAQSLTEEEKVTARRNIGIDGSTIGTKINVNGTPQDVVEFDSDPQGQIYRIGQGGMFVGKNILDASEWVNSQGKFVSYSNGVLVIKNETNPSWTPYVSRYVPCKPNTKYTFSVGNIETQNLVFGQIVNIYETGVTGQFFGFTNTEYEAGARSKSFTTKDGQTSFNILVYTGGTMNAESTTRTITNLQIEEGTTATEWEEYKGRYLNTGEQILSDTEKQTARNNINASSVSVNGVYKDSVAFTGDPQEQLNNRVFGASVSYVINGGAGWYRVADLSRLTSAYNFDMGGGYVNVRSPEVCGTLSIGSDRNIEPIVTVSHCRSSGWWSKFRVIYDKTAVSGTAYLEIYKTTATRELFGMSLIPEYETALFKVYREETAGSIPSGYTAVEYDVQDGANFPSLKVDGNPVLNTGEMTLAETEKQQARDNIGAYTKPSTGIPETDLAQDVQEKLDAISEKYTKPSTGIPETDLVQDVQEKLDAISEKYTKPSTGIPETDLVQDVQDKLDWTSAKLSTGSLSSTHTFLSPYEWVEQTWSGLTDFYGYDVWTDGTKIYYSSGTSQYYLNTSLNRWQEQTWSGLTNFSGTNMWTDGVDVYYSSGTSQYVLNRPLAKWEEKTWSGLTDFYGSEVWTDGTEIYYSFGTSHYVLRNYNWSSLYWERKSWSGLTTLSVPWTDGENIYKDNSMILDTSTSTWHPKTISSVSSFNSSMVWTDGENVYHSLAQAQHVFDRKTFTWIEKEWKGAVNDGTYSTIYGDCIWSDGKDIYYSRGTKQYKLLKSIISTTKTRLQ